MLKSFYCNVYEKQFKDNEKINKKQIYLENKNIIMIIKKKYNNKIIDKL